MWMILLGLCFVLIATCGMLAWLIVLGSVDTDRQLSQLQKRVTALEEGKPYRYKYVHCYLREADR